MTRSPLQWVVAVVLAVALPASAAAQDDDPAVLDLAQPDFTIVSLPTSLRVPTMKSAFRVNHRFGRSLGEGDFGDLLEDFFGLDNGAVIGLEVRFGILPNTQVGVFRTNDDKTIQFFGQYSIVRQPAAPLDIAAVVAIDGTNNFRDSYTPSLGAIVSRRISDGAALYVEPIWVNNSNQLPSELTEDNNTLLVGLGGRVRITPTVYLVGEFVPRVAGFDDGTHHAAFGIEKRAGGHVFQLNFSNSLATTFGQMARGSHSDEDWYLGFNISRKFF